MSEDTQYRRRFVLILQPKCLALESMPIQGKLLLPEQSGTVSAVTKLE